MDDSYGTFFVKAEGTDVAKVKVKVSDYWTGKAIANTIIAAGFYNDITIVGRNGTVYAAWYATDGGSKISGCGYFD